VGGLFCAPCEEAVLFEHPSEAMVFLHGHAPHDELYMVTEEPDGRIVRRGRVRRLEP
jgi:hypothetical protein